MRVRLARGLAKSGAFSGEEIKPGGGISKGGFSEELKTPHVGFARGVRSRSFSSLAFGDDSNIEFLRCGQAPLVATWRNWNALVTAVWRVCNNRVN